MKQVEVCMLDKLSMPERRLWTMMLLCAFDYVFDSKEHSIEIERILEIWAEEDESPKTKEELEKAIVNLNSHVMYSHYRGDKKLFGSFALLSYTQIYNGRLYYAYSEKFKELLFYPEIALELEHNGISCCYKLLALFDDNVIKQAAVLKRVIKLRMLGDLGEGASKDFEELF